ncbi:MAG: ThuA domain-containing protein [Bacteroidaceae bacterium]|nr:ThuA domain-containing protein [Bacteroidaceae bacterium]
MRKLLLLLLCVACIPSLIAARDSDLRGKTVLFVYGGWEGHQPRQCHELLKPWLEAEGAVVISSESLDVYADKDLMNRVDLVIQTWTMGNLTREQEQGLTQAVRRGVGLAGWHGGLGDSFRYSTEYQFMVGGQWVAHPGGIVEYDVNIRDKKDPVTKGLKRFHMRSEQYYMHVDPAVKVLATTRFSGADAPWIQDVVMPVVWKKRYGRGRVFYSSLCHVASDFRVPEALEIMKRGIPFKMVRGER